MTEKNTPYLGQITIISITNSTEPSYTGEHPIIEFTYVHQKFVSFPDCQQWIIWLPDEGRYYKTISVTPTQDDKVLFSHKVRDVLNGSIQILLDTSVIEPGKYRLDIIHINQFRHSILFEKLPEGKNVMNEPTLSIPFIEKNHGTNETDQYRETSANIVPDEDLLLRKQIIEKMKSGFLPELCYESHGRSGFIIYKEGNKIIKFEMEIGGGKCVFYVFLPLPSDWENHTGFPLSERDRIISFVASGTQRDQASGCRYEISEAYISYYRK